ncbi:MAG: bifunctional diguanylate cyclase/phosphodiesterase [Gemmatimonadota bacterium]|nr:bifunctional diguanylate cyclase/phosphodiesterase [Gemmatimonadota bacterium]
MRPSSDSAADAVANLPDHVPLMARLGEVLESPGGPRDNVAVISLNVDRFKVINHRFGLEAGDQLLVEVAQLISRCLRQEDTVARGSDIVSRIGADEFTIALSGVSSPEDALCVIARIRGALATPFRVDGEEVSITACYGIALHGVGDRPQQLLQNSSIALSRAKERGPDSHHLFEAGVDASEKHRLRLEHELREAAARGQFELHWQPIVSLADGAIARLEALLRWNHPELGRLSPVEFILVAEESGLILSIGRWVLGEACRQAQRWQANPSVRGPIRIAVNVSERELQHPSYHESVQEILRETGLEADSLELEITEGMLMRPAVDLRRLKSLGVSLSIDDFGTGNLSFTHLARLPVSTVKIDGSVVAGLGEDPRASTIVRAMLATAASYELETIAEAVETTRQLDLLRELGCTYGQGYLFAKPLLSGEAGSMLERP